MEKKRKKSEEEKALPPGYQELLSDIVGMIKETMEATRPLVDEETFCSMWGIKKKRSKKRAAHEQIPSETILSGRKQKTKKTSGK
jgi:hypothetical protein